MFLPIGDSPNPPGIPYVTYFLIGLNIVVFALVTLPLAGQTPDLNNPMLYEYLRLLGAEQNLPPEVILKHVSAYDLVVMQYGFRPAAASMVTLFSAMFLHANFMHLFGNMLFLWIYGDNVEHRLGRIGFLVAYLVTGVASTLFFTLFTIGSNVPMIGASGAISGVLGLYFIWFKRNQVKVFIFLFPFIMNTFMIPARLVLGFYLIIDNVFPFLLNSADGGGVAYGAHIGGFLAGMAIAFGLDWLPGMRKVQKIRKAPVDESPGRRQAEADQTPAQAIAAHLRDGDFAGAARHYFSLDSREERLGLNSDVVLSLGEYLLGIRAYEEAQTLFRRFISDRPNDREVDRAFLGAGKSMIHQPRHIPSAYQYFLSAIETARSKDLEVEARMHLRGIEQLGENRD
jgi:membrane associated rhomboid family serine protease